MQRSRAVARSLTPLVGRLVSNTSDSCRESRTHWAESTNLVPFKSWRATMRAQRDTYACRHGTGVGSSSVRSLASKFFNGGSTWLVTWPWQCEEALKSRMFSGVDGRALDAALLHRKKLRDPLFRAMLHARSMRSVLAVSDTTENRAIVLLVLR